MTLSDTLTVPGEAIVSIGTIGADYVEIAGRVSGNGLVSGEIAMISSTAPIRADTGPLTLGSAAGTDGFRVSSGSLEVTDEIVTLLDANTAALADVTTIAGGTVVAANGISLGDAVGGGAAPARSRRRPSAPPASCHERLLSDSGTKAWRGAPVDRARPRGSPPAAPPAPADFLSPRGAIPR